MFSFKIVQIIILFSSYSDILIIDFLSLGVNRNRMRDSAVDHGTTGCAYSCTCCSQTRQAYKHKKKKAARNGKFIEDDNGEYKDFIILKSISRLPIPRLEGKRFTDHFYFP